MSLITLPFTFSVGAVIVASQHNSCFSIIYSDYNGNIQDANIASNAGISDTKLGQITTAGKVSGAALTSLTSIPAGAGLIPTANLGSGSTSTKLLSGAQTYLDPNTLITAQLGTWTTKLITTIYQAATDGFAILDVSNSGGGNYSIVSDSSATPSTSRGHIGLSANGTGTITTPVKKGDYWEVLLLSGSAGTYVIHWIPLGT